MLNIAVKGEDISGMGVTVSGPSSTAPMLLWCSLPPETLGHVQGTVVDADGQPVAGVWVTANVHGDSGVYEGEWTASDGTFHLRLRHGVYWLHVRSDRSNECTVSGQEDAGGPGGAVFDTRDGDVADLRITVAGPDSASPVWAVCYFDAPFLWIEGTVLGPDGEPVAGIAVRAYGEPEEPSYGPWSATASDSDGTFAVEVPAGAYVLGFFLELSGSECRLGFAGLDGGHSFGFPFDKRLTVDGAAVTGINVSLPGTRSDLCKPIRGVVTDSDGGPLRVAITADRHGPAQDVRADFTSTPDGTFTLYGPAGRYNVLVATTAGSECTVVDHPDSRPGQKATIVVGEEGAGDIRVVVSGEPGTELQRFYCSFPPEMVTTELQPGWNLAGWTEEKAPVADLFDAIPQLEAVYWWDAATQSFRGAVRSDSGPEGTLDTVAPGLGLWLAIGGAEQVP